MIRNPSREPTARPCMRRRYSRSLPAPATVVPLYLLARWRSRAGGLGGGGTLAPGPGRQPLPAGRRHGLSLALDVRPGPGRLGRVGGTPRNGRLLAVGVVLAVASGAVMAVRDVLHPRVSARSD